MTIILLGNCSKKRLGKSVEKNLKNVAFNIDIFNFGGFNRKYLRLPGACGIVEKLILSTSADSESGAFRQSLEVFREVGCRRKRKPNGGKENERYFNETASGSRRTFRTPDKKMEP